MDKGNMPQEFYCSPADVVARRLLGKELVHHSAQGVTSGIIVETEAYMGPGDDASHSAKSKTRRNATMFGSAGRAYVYLIYGIHYCFNVTTDCDEVPSAVLIRALQPKLGLDLMRQRRRKDNLTQLCSGPGKLAQAMAFSMDLDGCSMLSDQLFARPGIAVNEREIVITTRVGISKAIALPLRFYLSGNAHVSVK